MISNNKIIPLIFENENFVIANKPAGYLSVPSRFQDKDERPVLGRVLEEQLRCRLFPVHRLDFEVSGLILYAKNPKAHQVSNQWFENKKVQKIYKALTTGMPPEQNKFEWQSKILRGKKRTYESPIGKHCLTRAEYLGKMNDYLFWQLEPVTGRSHQLRFDLSRHGFPVVGDKLYGSQVSLSDDSVNNLPSELIYLGAVAIYFPNAAKDFGLQSEYHLEMEWL